MKDWRRSPEPPGMMGLKDAAYPVQGNWGQPEELQDFDPASPLPHTTPTIFLAGSRTHAPAAHQSDRVHSLYSMCLRVILRNISSVQDLGVLPYHHAKPILEECRIDQLILLEETSPHLLEHSEEIWKRNCLRDFIDLRKKYTPIDDSGTTALPREPKSWRKLYFRTKGEIEQAKVDAAKRIKDKYEQHRAEKEAKKLVVRDRPMMAKTARTGGRKFGLMAAGMGGGAGGGVTKGQSLLNKARSGSAAQAKLTAPRNGRSAFRTQGRSQAVGAEIAPEAAGVRQMVRPMVAPRKVLDGAHQGLEKMRAFSRPMPGSEGSADERKATARGADGTAAPVQSSRKPAATSQQPDTVGATSGRYPADSDSVRAVPRLKPHQVAAAPPLTSTSLIRGSGAPSSMAANTATSPDSSKRRQAPSSPPPDIARAERRKLDFFGAARPSPTSSSTLRGASSAASSSTTQVRGVKRAHSNGTNNGKSGSPRAASPPPASSPSGATSFFGRVNGGSSGVRVVQAKRARASEPMAAAASSPRNSPAPASPGTTPCPSRGTSDLSIKARPSPIRQPGSSSSKSLATPPMQDAGTARASPAALSSIFVRPSSQHRTGSHGG